MCSVSVRNFLAANDGVFQYLTLTDMLSELEKRRVETVGKLPHDTDLKVRAFGRDSEVF